MKVPIRPGNFDEVVIRVIEEDTGKEVAFGDSIRATLCFHKPTDTLSSEDSTPVTNLTKSDGSKAVDPSSVRVFPYRKRMETVQEKGLFLTKIPEYNLYSQAVKWDDFKKPV